MSKVVLVCILLCMTSSMNAQYKTSWQRLTLLLGATYLVVTKEGQVEHDSCLYIAARSLGISRFPVLAEGFESPELFKQSQWIDEQQPGKGVQLLAAATGRRHSELLLLLGAYYVFQPGNYKKYRDSVAYYLNKVISLHDEKTSRIALCLLGKMYVQANEATGDSIYNVLIDQCRKAGDPAMEARAYAYRGMYTAPTKATLLKKVSDLQQAAKLYENLHDTESLINVLTDLGYMLVVTRQPKQASEILLKALTLEERIHYPYTHYNTDALAMADMFQGKYGEPLRYAMQSVRTAESTKDSLGMAYFYSRLAQFYDNEDRQEAMLKMVQKGIDRFIIDRNPAVYNLLYLVLQHMPPKEALALTMDIANKVGPATNISDQLFYYYALSSCYLSLDNLGLAETYIHKADSLETIAEMTRGPLRRDHINDQYALIYYKRGEYRKAREWFEKRWSSHSTVTPNLTSFRSNYRYLFSIDSALGDHVAEIAHYKQYTRLLESNFRASKIRQAEELQVMYETKEKESMIALLNKEAEQATLVRNLTLAGIAAVLIIAGLLYRQNRLKQKNNVLIKLKSDQLQQLLTDREWLLKEIHHRVKNNLQIVMSLLNSQAIYINNEAAQAAIQDSKRRVYAMSLIHQKLYQSENIATIYMPDYINELVNHVKDSFGIDQGIVFKLDVEAIDLDVSQAIPLGLIINESVVNAVKYAFPEGRDGWVCIRLVQDGADHLLLNISDNGIGVPEDFETTAHHSLGLELIQGLARQLKGKLEMSNEEGFHIAIWFARMQESQLANYE